MDLRDFIEYYAEEVSGEQLYDDVIMGVGYNMRINGSYSNIINGRNFTIDANRLSEIDFNNVNGNDKEDYIAEYITILDGSHVCKNFIAECVLSGLEGNHLDRRYIFVFRDEENKKYKFSQIIAEFAYTQTGFPAVLYKRGKIKFVNKLHEESYIAAMTDKEYRKHVKKCCNKIISAYKENRRDTWAVDYKRRIRDMESMSFNELLEEVNALPMYVDKPLKKKSVYDKIELIEILSEYYGTDNIKEETIEKNMADIMKYLQEQ
jgi:hypothetical protein